MCAAKLISPVAGAADVLIVLVIKAASGALAFGIII